MADETVHTRLAFDLASRYAGRDVSAGPLPMSGALENDDLETVLRLVIHEGCVGETVAALEAVEAQAHCTVPEVTRVLERIAEDERNHAALAWRFVAWAIARSEELRDVAAREFARIAAAALPVVETAPAGDLRAHGALPPSLRREVHLAALRDVVVPCAERLLAEQAHSQDLVPARVG